MTGYEYYFKRYSNEREKWFKFKEYKTMERIREWLKEEGIELVYKNYRIK
ncbi:MAG: hypothetical protein ACTSRG_23570 [Candidatus Helarchaeota archaeon]